MTPEQRAKELYEGVLADCMNVTGQHAGCAGPAVHIEEAIRAALRERDAEHEVALKNARADALDAAAALFDKKDAEARAETYFVTQPYGGVREEHPNGYYMSAREAARAIRALLEEAGK